MTSGLSALEKRVARHYSERVFEAEMRRLIRDCPVELAITTRAMERFIRPDSKVVEVGVGGGHYSESLARRGCSLHLVDIALPFLTEVVRRFGKAHLRGQVVGIHHASAANLSFLPDGSMDAVLLLGPLYHLQTQRGRQLAVREAWRVLKKRGVVLAAGINRLSYLRDLYREAPREGLKRRAFHAQYLRHGNLTPAYAPPIGFAHMTTIQEFRRLFRGRFKEISLTGVESFASPFQGVFLDFSLPVAAAWLDLIEETGKTPEGLGLSDHFLFVGRK